MSVITFVCAGQMNSAITFPAFENLLVLFRATKRVAVNGVNSNPNGFLNSYNCRKNKGE